MIIIKKIWNFIKKCWYIPVGILVSLITFLVVRKDDSTDDIILKTLEDSKEKQIDAIITSEEEKKESKIVIEEEYEIAIKKIEKTYNRMNATLNRNSKEYIKELHEKYRNEPDEISKKIKKRFGIEYVANKNTSSDNDI